MNRKQALIGFILCAAPLVVVAQNTNTPGGQASTGTPLEQTKTTSQKPAFTKPARSSTPDATTNETGGTMTKRSRAKVKNTTPAGDVPTYPAPAPDGTPTK